MHTLRLAAAAVVGLALSSLSAQPPPGPPPPPCSEADGYVCGQQGPEDLVALGDDWVVASALAGTGGINVIRVADRMSFLAYPADSATAQLDAETYPDCPGPPDTGEFTSHGLYIESGEGSMYTLFVVGHGARESIEVFEIDTRGTMPAFTWIGCAIAPGQIGLNSVRGLPGGGFITTNFNARDESMTAMMSGEINGELWEWHTATGWEIVPGSEASGANGVELSEDGETIYVAAWGSQKFFRLSRGIEPPVREEIDLDFRPDNIHWAHDGRLIAVGHVGQDWRIVMIDPDTLAIEEVYRQDAIPAFGGGTAALEVGGEFWVGSYRGDRIAVVPRP
jgi:hypothetical protein